MRRRQAEPTAPGRFWKVGELAERTGLTIRTLHHYDAIGLLNPTGRTDSSHGSGHRLYARADLARLQQILSLKQLGFSLDQIREYLARADYDPKQVVRLHLARVQAQAAELTRLGERLTALAEALEKAEVVSADEFLSTIEGMTMIEKYYTPEQLEQIKVRGEAVGQERIEQVQQEWPVLMDRVRAAMSAGIAPTDPQAQDLAHTWFGLVNEFTGGDPGIARSLKRMYENEDNIQGMDVAAMRPMMDYIGKAAMAAGIEIPGS